MAYLVKRQYGRYGVDYLLEWDVIWGPVWVGSARLAKRFNDLGCANDAAVTAIECMRPVPWIVPDMGQSTVMVEGV
jgi:hypothetical protein